MSSGYVRTGRPRSDCADAQSDLGLRCPLTESLDTTECMNGEQKLGLQFAHAQDDQNLGILRMFDGTFSLDAAHIIKEIQPGRNRKQSGHLLKTMFVCLC